MKKQNILAIAFIALIISIINFNLSAQCVNCDANSSASGSYASAMGMSASATGQASLAVGLEAYADGNYSLALGKYVTSTGASSVTLGRYLEAATSPAMIIGTGYNSSNYLVNSNSNSLMIGFNSNKSTLFVKGATGIGYTGKVGIGDVTDPQAKLHIKADDGEAASLFLESYSFGGSYAADLWMGTQDYGLRAMYGKLYFNTGGNYIFNSANANVGIGVLTPHEKLEVSGNIKQSPGFYIETDKVKATGENGLKLQDDSGLGPIVKNGGKLGINVPNPTYDLDVDGTVSTTGFRLDDGNVTDGFILQTNADGIAHWTDPMLLGIDDNDWVASGSNIYRQTGMVGIGEIAPDCRLHIKDNPGNTDAVFFKVSNEGVLGGGNTYIGKSINNGPIFTQQAGNVNFDNSGPHLAIKQKANNGDVGLDISTFTDMNGDIAWADIEAPNSSFYLIARDDIIFRTGISKFEQMYIKANGDVGIGIDPQAKFHVNGDAIFENAIIDGATINENINIGAGISTLSIGGATGSSLNYGTSYIGFNAHRYYEGTWKWKTNNDGQNNGGAVIYSSIAGDIIFSDIESTGASNQVLSDAQIISNAKLVITHSGVVKVNELEIKTSIWPDYVFNDDYKLRSLEEIERFISIYQHLPDVPSEKEVIENGVNVGEMNALLLQKIEELTLYVIQQNKRIEELERKINL